MRFTHEERNQTVWQRLEAALVDAGADDISKLMRPLFGYVLKERNDARVGIRRVTADHPTRTPKEEA